MISAKWISLIFVIIAMVLSGGKGKSFYDPDDLREVILQNFDYERSSGKF